jgi:hypothetical protein
MPTTCVRRVLRADNNFGDALLKRYALALQLVLVGYPLGQLGLLCAGCFLLSCHHVKMIAECLCEHADLIVPQCIRCEFVGRPVARL